MRAVPFKLESGKFADDFHLFELEWDEEKMIWSIDGKEFITKLISDNKLSAFHKEFFILLNIAVGGEFAGRPDSTTTFPQFMYVDWIRLYKKK